MAKRTQSKSKTKMWPAPKPSKKSKARAKAKPQLTREQLTMLVAQYHDALDQQVQEIVDPVMEKLNTLLEQHSNPESAPVQRAIISEVLRLLDCKIAGCGWKFTYQLKYDDPRFDLQEDSLYDENESEDEDEEDVDGRNY